MWPHWHMARPRCLGSLRSGQLAAEDSEGPRQSLEVTALVMPLVAAPYGGPGVTGPAAVLSAD